MLELNATNQLNYQISVIGMLRAAFIGRADRDAFIPKTGTVLYFDNYNYTGMSLNSVNPTPNGTWTEEIRTGLEIVFETKVGSGTWGSA